MFDQARPTLITNEHVSAESLSAAERFQERYSGYPVDWKARADLAEARRKKVGLGNISRRADLELSRFNVAMREYFLLNGPRPDPWTRIPRLRLGHEAFMAAHSRG